MEKRFSLESHPHEPELTSHERDLLQGNGPVRGYVPSDGVAEPSQAPVGPAGASGRVAADAEETGEAGAAGPVAVD